ncbi:MAG: hypothetical protein PUB18_05730 [bacterium]|nr:hypothetical protein [bacterium]
METDACFYQKKIEIVPPEGRPHKKNKKGLASVILATNSPIRIGDDYTNRKGNICQPFFEKVEKVEKID